MEKKCAQSGCTSLKIVHPALKMCTSGAGCMLYFEHCMDIQFIVLLTLTSGGCCRCRKLHLIVPILIVPLLMDSYKNHTHFEGPVQFDTHFEGPSFPSFQANKRTHFPHFSTHTFGQISQQVNPPGVKHWVFAYLVIVDRITCCMPRCYSSYL